MAEYDGYFSLAFIFQLGFGLFIVDYLARTLFHGTFNPSPYAPTQPNHQSQRTQQQQQQAQTQTQAPVAAPASNAPLYPPPTGRTQAQPQPQSQPQPQRPLLTPQPTIIGQLRPQFQIGGQYPARPRARLIPAGQAPHGQIPRPPWRAPNFRNVVGTVERPPVAEAVRIRGRQRIVAAPPAAVATPAARPQVTQMPAGTAQTGNGNVGDAAPAIAPVAPPPAASEPAAADSRIREPGLLQPLLLVGSVNVGFPVQSAWNTDHNGLWGGGRPLFGRGIRIQNDNNNVNSGGDGNGNGATQTTPPPAAATAPAGQLPPGDGQTPPAAAPQDENNNGATRPVPGGRAVVDAGNEQATPAVAPQDQNNNGANPTPEGQTLVEDPNGFWETACTIDPDDAGVVEVQDEDVAETQNAGVNFDTQRNPWDDVHDYTNNPNLDRGGDVVMMDVDEELNHLERQQQEQFMLRWMGGGFTQEEMNRYSQGERLRAMTSLTATQLQRWFRRWQREFMADFPSLIDENAGQEGFGEDGGATHAPQGSRDV